MNTIDELLQQLNDPDFSAAAWNPQDIDKLIIFVRENRGTPVKKVTARSEPAEPVVKLTLKDLGFKPAPKLVVKRRV